ncbi:hypothetical protein SY88_14405 [Clostridiales bacterium PH28_bin88]|nr:hypothetical protein SY88_14405 [Clostridiales bacterium PH28_bin88]
MVNPVSRRVRDLTLIEVDKSNCLVIACDSSGGIGPKQGDAVQVPGYVVGRMITRVALMEVMASGAAPISVVDTLSVEMHPTGEEILRGVKDEVVAAGLDPLLVVTGSTEENIPTHQTAMGVTVIGWAGPGDLRLGKARAGDRLLCIGLPKVGREVSLDDPENADIQALRTLLALPGVHELLPVGSKGIAYEAIQLAETAGLSLAWDSPVPVDLQKPAGPATCLLAAIDPGTEDQVLKMVDQPVIKLATLVSPCDLEQLRT